MSSKRRKAGAAAQQGPTPSWFSVSSAASAHDIVTAATSGRKWVDVPYAQTAASSSLALVEREPHLTREQNAQAETNRVRRTLINALVKRLTKAREFLSTETYALTTGSETLVSWSDGNVSVIHPLQLALQRFRARWNARAATECARAAAEEQESGCATEGVGQADVARALEHDTASHGRPVLELVSYDWEESMLRAPRGRESACANKQNCLGVVLLRDGFVKAPPPLSGPTEMWDLPEAQQSAPTPDTGFPLVAFCTPAQMEGKRPRSRDGLCLLCVRNRVTWTYRALSSSGTPANACITPHRVAVGEGEYSPDVVLCGATPSEGGFPNFAGVFDPFPECHYGDYDVVRTATNGLRYTQRASVMRFRPAPHTVLAPFSEFGGAGWIIIRTECSASKLNEVREEFCERIPKLRALQSTSVERSLSAFRAAFLDVRCPRLPRRALERALFQGWQGTRVRHKVKSVAAEAAAVRAVGAAVPYRDGAVDCTASASRVRETLPDSAEFVLGAVRVAFAGSEKAQIAFARARLRAQSPETLVESLCDQSPNVLVWGLRAFVVRLVKESGSLRAFMLDAHGVRWSDFEQRADFVVRAMLSGIRDLPLAQEDGEVLMRAEQTAVACITRSFSQPIALVQPRKWFWETLAVITKPKFQELESEFCGRAGIRSRVPIFDARWAYRGPLAAARASGSSSEACDFVDRASTAKPQDLKHMFEELSHEVQVEIVYLCTAIVDAFSCRIIRAPLHWQVHQSRLGRRTFMLCPACRQLKAHVAMSREEWMRTKRGRTPATAAVELKRHAAYCKKHNGRNAISFEEWMRKKQGRTPEMAAAELRKQSLVCGTAKVAFDPKDLVFYCNPKQKNAKLREFIAEEEEARERSTKAAAHEEEHEDFIPSFQEEQEEPEPEPEEQTLAAPKRNVTIPRTCVSYVVCQRTVLVPIDFQGALVEINGRLLAQCWSCGTPCEVGLRCYLSKPGAFLCGWCTPPLPAPDTRFTATGAIAMNAGKRRWVSLPELKGGFACFVCGEKLAGSGSACRNWRTVRCIRVPECPNPARCVEMVVCPAHSVPRRYTEFAVAVYDELKRALEVDWASQPAKAKKTVL